MLPGGTGSPSLLRRQMLLLICGRPAYSAAAPGATPENEAAAEVSVGP